MLLTVFFSVVSVNAQEIDDPDEIAKKYGVTFPIAELGGCESLAQCRIYCEDPINQTTCVAYAQAKGFYNDDELDDRQEELLESAKTELGCDSKLSCEAACHEAANFDKCSLFAARHGISGGHVNDLAKQEIISKAKEILGCDSEANCRTICNDETNRNKCDSFAKQVGLRGGETRRGPGGCTSRETCQTYCSDPDHFQECSQFGGKQGRGNFSGPGGCNSEESCRQYCQQNPDQCHFNENQTQKRDEIEKCFGSGRFWYEDKCNDKPMSEYFDRVKDPKVEECFRSGRVWDGSSCRDRSEIETQYMQRKGQNYADFCRDNPEKCRPGESGGFANPQERREFEERCRQNPEFCKENRSGSYREREKAECESPAGRERGCSWTGDRCNCPGYSGSSGTGSGGSYNTQSNCPAGTYWNGSSCTSSTYTNPTSPPQQNQRTPEQMCAEAPNCHWENNSCRCESSGGGSSGSLSPEEQCRQSGKCWQDGSCRDCQQSGGGGRTSSGNPEEMCRQTPNCRWENNSCQCTQGATTGVNFFDRILYFFASIFGR